MGPVGDSHRQGVRLKMAWESIMGALGRWEVRVRIVQMEALVFSNPTSTTKRSEKGGNEGPGK